MDLVKIAKQLEDPYWRINNLYWIINEDSERVLFKMRYAQEEFYKGMWYWNELLKSRQHGFSTLIDIMALDMCLWNNNIEAGIVAHTLKDVQHIFATKIKYPYENLDPAILKRIPATKCDANELKLSNNSWLRVATSMRSSTLRFLHISERGKMCAKFPKKAEELKTGTIPTLHEGSYLFDESTAEGGAGDFYDAVVQAMSNSALEKQGKLKLNKMQARGHFFAWFDDPKNQTEPEGIPRSDELNRYFNMLLTDHSIMLTENQKAWYALKRDGANGLGRLMKREHPSFWQEAFEQAVEGAVFGRELEDCRGGGRVGFYPHRENEPVYTFWDLGVGHATAIGFLQFIGEAVHIIDYHEMTGRGIVYHCKVVLDKPYIYGGHYLPHDAQKRSRETETPLIDTAEELLGKGKVTLVPRCGSKGDSIQAARMLFPFVHFHAKKCGGLLKCLGFYRFGWDDKGSRFTDKPCDDWSADAADMFQCAGMVWVTMSISGKRLGRTKAIIGNIPALGSAYDNNVLTRGMAS